MDKDCTTINLYQKSLEFGPDEINAVENLMNLKPICRCCGKNLRNDPQPRKISVKCNNDIYVLKSCNACGLRYSRQRYRG